MSDFVFPGQHYGHQNVCENKVIASASADFVPPQPLSREKVKEIADQCDERFIKLQVQRILVDQETPVNGVMLVTPDCVLFDPEESVQLNAASKYSMTVPMNCVARVSVFHENMSANSHQFQSLSDCPTSADICSAVSCDAQATQVHCDLSEAPTDIVPSASVQICLCITSQQSLSSTRPSAASSYWYLIPYDRVDQLYAFFLQWSCRLDEDSDSLSREGFVVVSKSETNMEHSELMHKDWEIVNVKELCRQICQSELDKLPLPELSHTSDILLENHLRLLVEQLPPRAEGSSWRLVYSSSQHGFSLRTLYRQTADTDSPILLVVKDSDDTTLTHWVNVMLVYLWKLWCVRVTFRPTAFGSRRTQVSVSSDLAEIFGTMQSVTIKKSDLFYGTGESYLYTFYPEFQKFGWTGVNTYFIKGDDNGLCFGASKGNYGLWLDEDLYHGRTKSCSTYNNKVLTHTEDFTIKFLEVWSFE